MLLEVQGLQKKFAQRAVIRDLSFQLKAGEVLGIIGESGCGKSTLARLITGLLHADAGRILYEGQTPDSMSRRDRARSIQMMFQDSGTALHPRLRIGTALLEVLENVVGQSREEAQEQLKAWLSRLDLPQDILNRFPHQLSGGQKQRVCLLRALLLKPKVLVCDEPLTALDRMTQAKVLQLLRDLRQDLGFAMIFISHDMTTVRTLADQVGVMYAGQWMEYGATADVLGKPQHPYTQYLLQSLPKLYRDPGLRSIPAFQELSAEQPASGCPLALRCPFAEASCAHLEAQETRNRIVHCVKPGVF